VLFSNVFGNRGRRSNSTHGLSVLLQHVLSVFVIILTVILGLLLVADELVFFTICDANHYGKLYLFPVFHITVL